MLVLQNGFANVGEPFLQSARKAQARGGPESEGTSLSRLTGAHATALLGGVLVCILRVSYTFCVQSVNLSYKLKLFPSVNKADTLALLAALFQRAHADCTTLMRQGEGRLPSTKGLGEFIGRAYRRAYIDYRRTTKAGHTPGALKAELIDAAEVQQPRKATGFDLWIMLRGTTTSRGQNGGFYVPANRHRAINRTLALPGAKLNESAEVFRSAKGRWYARVSVSVPLAEVQAPQGWIGCDVGVRAAVTRSDGYQGPDLRPILKRQKQRRADQQRVGLDRSYTMSPQRQALAHEARKAISVSLRSRRGISLEDPAQLPRWKQWSAKFFAQRILLLAAVVGVPVRLLRPAYSSLTCSRCTSRDTFRKKTCFRCHRCGFTHNADINGARNLASGAYVITDVSHGSRSLSSLPSGGGAVA